MNVLIVESPAKAKTINKYLGKDFKVLASFGHVRDLPSKDGSVRPDEDFAMDYEVSGDSKKHVKEIADAVKNSDALYLATDPDREGEAISWHVVEALKNRKALKKNVDIHRVTFNEITKRAVTKAVENPRDIDMDLVNAQQARRALDYLVGFNLSPVLWRKLPGSKSAGRVQSVALRLVCEREEEIETFISKEYWSIQLDLANQKAEPFKAFLTHWQGNKLDKFDIADEKTATGITTALESKAYQVLDIQKKQVRRNPHAPFTTSSLQQEASRKLGFGAKKTMMIAQKLYEGIDIGGDTTGLITYMRTDGVTVSQEAIDGSRSTIASLFGDNYVPDAPREYKSKAKNAQEAHEAIRPTDVSRQPKDLQKLLSEDHLKLYELIWKRMIASQMESAVLDQVAVDIKSNDGEAQLRATGSTIRFDGFLKLYQEGKDDHSDADEGKILPPLAEGEDLALKEVTPEQHFTQPPPRYSEASLVKKMEELGIGRPSTYASIISVLQDREYVRLEKKRFIPEERGRLVTAFLVSYFPKYVEYDFTAHLEEELDRISDGKINWKELLQRFWGDFSKNVDSAKEYTIQEVLSSLETLLERHIYAVNDKGEIDKQCPTCNNGELNLKVGKFGSFLGCSNYPDCKHTKQIGDTAEGSEGGSALGNEPKQLGIDPETKLEVTLRKGPYGFYIQLGEALEGEKPKRTSVPKTVNPEDVDFEKAQALLSLPREVGLHPEDGKKIVAAIGPYGPYIRHASKFYSIKGDDDVLTIGMNRAVAMIAEGGKKSNEPLRTLGKHPDTDKDINVFDGRYGPYVKHEKTNATLPDGTTPESVTLEEAIMLLAAKKGAKKKTKKKTTKKTKK